MPPTSLKTIFRVPLKVFLSFYAEFPLFLPSPLKNKGLILQPQCRGINIYFPQVPYCLFSL